MVSVLRTWDLATLDWSDAIYDAWASYLLCVLETSFGVCIASVPFLRSLFVSLDKAEQNSPSINSKELASGVSGESKAHPVASQREREASSMV